MNKKALLILLMPIFIAHAFAMSSADETRYTALTKEIRCVVCQNQNIADSNAPLANDLRRKVHAMVEENKSDNDIKDYLVARYGEFILLKPRLNKLTLVLWLLPLTSLVVVLGIVLHRHTAVFGRRRTALPSNPQIQR